MKGVALLQRHYPESRFGGFSDIDGTIMFYTRIQALLQPDSHVLDVGCGRGAAAGESPVAWKRRLLDLRGSGRKVIGLDIDPDAASTPSLMSFT